MSKLKMQQNSAVCHNKDFASSFTLELFRWKTRPKGTNRWTRQDGRSPKVQNDIRSFESVNLSNIIFIFFFSETSDWSLRAIAMIPQRRGSEASSTSSSLSSSFSALTSSFFSPSTFGSSLPNQSSPLQNGGGNPPASEKECRQVFFDCAMWRMPVSLTLLEFLCHACAYTCAMWKCQCL